MSLFGLIVCTPCIRCARIATDGVAWSVCLCVCWSRSWALQKTAEPIEMLVGAYSRVDPKNHVCRDPPTRSCNFGGTPAHRKALEVTATALYAAKKNQRRQRDCGSRMQCSRLVGATLHCPPVKNPPPAMRPFAKILWPLVHFCVILYWRAQTTHPPATPSAKPNITVTDRITGISFSLYFYISLYIYICCKHSILITDCCSL